MQMAHGRKLVIAMPYVWLILLFLLPFLIVFQISLAEMARRSRRIQPAGLGRRATNADAESG
jgi:ABC-type spermidine/putrescine transport system permease subunit I